MLQEKQGTVARTVQLSSDEGKCSNYFYNPRGHLQRQYLRTAALMKYIKDR